jgi:nitrogen fixation NifU-like protein
MFIKVGKNENDEEIIDDIKFRTFGCGSAVATSSMITEMAKGKTLDDAYKITRQDVAEELEGLPPIKMHCSNLAADALQAAIRNYREGTSPEVEVAATCEIAREIKVVLGIEEFLNKGVYNRLEDPALFKDRRVLVVESGEESIKFALELTKHTGRVILVTNQKSVPGNPDLQKSLKLSDVKILQQSELLEIMGTDTVEKVRINNLDEDEEYELFVDNVIILE